MHRDEQFRVEVDKGARGFLRVHVHIASARRFVSADRHQRDVDVVLHAYLGEAAKVRAISAVKHALAAGTHDVAAVIAVRVVKETRAPMVRRRVDDLELIKLQLIPDAHLVGRGKPEFFHQRPAALRHHDPLAGLQNLETRLVQVIEVRVRHQHEINLRHTMQVEPGLTMAFHRPMPLRPVWIDDHRVPGKLQEKGRVPDPCDAHLAILRRRQHRLEHIARAAAKHSGHDAMA